MAALGAANHLVGVDAYSTFPPEVVELPKVGDFLSPKLEAIVRLQPDLVFLDEVQAKTAKALARADIRTVSVRMHNIEDLRASITSISGALERPEAAAKLLQRIDAAIARARATSADGTRPRALLIIDRSPGGLRGLVAAGPGSFLHELVTIAGADNALAKGSVMYPKISPEQVIRAAPDIVLDASQGGKGALADWNKLKIPAVQSKRVHHLGEAYFLSPSPRVGQALETLERLLTASGK